MDWPPQSSDGVGDLRWTYQRTTFKLVRIVCFLPYILYHLLTLAKYKKKIGVAQDICTLLYAQSVF